MSSSRSLRRAVLAVLVLGTAAAVAAQPQRMNAAEHHARLAESLNLSSAQSELVREALGEEPGPGSLWALAAELAPTLSDEQKARLFARPERHERGAMRRGGERRERPRDERRVERRAERRERPDAEARRAAMQEHQAARREAMVAALNLSPRQVEQLGALREEHRAQRSARRAERQAQRERGERGQRRDRQRREPGLIPADLAEILNADQEEVWVVHQALVRRMHSRGAHHRGQH